MKISKMGNAPTGYSAPGYYIDIRTVLEKKKE